MKKYGWLLVIISILMAMMTAGAASAEETLVLNTPVWAEVYNPGDVKYFQYTPTVNGIYEFSSIAEEGSSTGLSRGIILDEDRQIIAEGEYRGDYGVFSACHMLSAGKTYYFAAMYSDDEGWFDNEQSYRVKLIRREGIVARAQHNIVHSNLNQGGTVQVEAWSVNGGLRYQWYDGNTAIAGATQARYRYPALTAAKTYRCVITDAGNNSAEVTIEARVNSELTFTMFGYGTVVDCGGSATLSVDATAVYRPEDITYQWYRQGTAETNYSWIELAGETGATLTATNINRTGYYICEMTDTNGEAWTAWFRVKVRGDVRLTAPKTEFTPEPGDSVTMAVTATTPDDCKPLTYQWVESGDGYTRKIEGATGASYTIEHANEVQYYYCEVTNSVGNSSQIWFYVYPEVGLEVTSDTADEEPEYTWYTTVSINAGESIALKVNATGQGTITYKWTKYDAATGRYTVIPNATAASYQASKAGWYNCTVMNSYGYSIGHEFEVRVNNGFSVQAGSPTEVQLTPGETTTLKVNATGTGLIYRWYRREYTKTGNNYQSYSSRELITGAESDSLTITGERACDYQCAISDAMGHKDWIAFDIVVDNGFTVTAGETNFNVAAGAAVTLTANAQHNSGALYYEWIIENPQNWSKLSIPGAAGSNTLTLEHVGANNWGNYYVTVSDDYGNSWIGTYIVRVENHFSAERVGDSNRTVKPGGSTELAVSVSCDDMSTVSCQWYEETYRIENDGSYSNEYTPIDGATGTTYTVSNANKQKGYFCRVTDSYGAENNFFFYITIDNELTATALNNENGISVRPKQTATLTVNASCKNGTLSYQWYKEEDYTWWGDNPISGATGATYHTEAISESEEYICVVSDQYGNTSEIWFWVEIDNQLTAEALNEKTSFTVLPGETATLGVDASCYDGELTYTWYQKVYSVENDESSASWQVIASATGTTYTTEPLRKSGELYRCEVRDEYDGVAAVPFYIEIDNQLTAEALNGENYIYVQAGETAAMTAVANCHTGELTYTWYKKIYAVENDESTASWQIIDGATSASYTPAQMDRIGWMYYCQVDDEYGNRAEVPFYNSIENELTAGPLNDENNILIPVGETATLTVIANCNIGEMTYQWYEYNHITDDEQDYWDWVKINGATAAAYATEPLSTGRKEFYCHVRDQYGNSIIVNFIVHLDNELTVTPVGTKTRRIDLGADTILGVTAACKSGGVTYQWYRLVRNEEDVNYWSIIDGAESSSYTAEDVTGKSEYRCRVTDEYDNEKAVEFRIYIENELTVRGDYDGNSYVPDGETTTLNIIASCKTGNIYYQWYKYDQENYQYTAIAGATESSYTTAPQHEQSSEYFCHISDDYGNETSNYFWVYLESGLTAEPDGAYIFQASEAPITMTVNASNHIPEAQITYRWYNAQGYEVAYGTENSYTPEVPTAGRYQCEVYDGNMHQFVYFYIADGAYGFAAEGSGYYDKGETATMHVIAWNEAGDITYQWYDGKQYDPDTNEYAPIDGATGQTYSFVANSSEIPMCHITGTDLDKWAVFNTFVRNELRIDPTGLQRVYVFPTGGSVQLTMNVISDVECEPVYSWYKNWQTIEGETSNTLTVTESGEYEFSVSDQMGNGTNASIYCIEGAAATVSEGQKVTGSENGSSVYQLIPAKTGMYQVEAEGAYIYPAGEYDSNVYIYGTETKYLRAGKAYYIVLNYSNNTFRYTLAVEEKQQTEYSVIMPKGLTLRVQSNIYAGNRDIYYDHTTSSDQSVIRVISDDTIELRKEGTADVTVTYENGMERIFHITVMNQSAQNTITLPEQLTTIEEDAFRGMTSAKFIRLGDHVQTVKRGAFAGTGTICLIAEGYYVNINARFEEGVFANANPIVICRDGDIGWYCRNHGIPYFWID